MKDIRPLLAFVAFCLLTVFSPAMSQNANSGKYFIGFANKAGTSFNLTNPAAFLSERAILRRQNQGIAIYSTDLPVNQNYADSVQATGASILNRSKWMNGLIVVVPSDSVLSQIQALPFVSYTQKVHPLIAKSLPSLPNTGLRPAAENPSKSSSLNYGSAFNQVMMMNGHILHNQGFTGQGKIIAVLDAGFYNVQSYAVFDSLWDQNRILGWKDFVDQDDSVFEDHPHGMQVLSVMGGNSPGNLVGTAPGASYWLLRSETASSEYLIEEDNWVVAAEFADSVGADIINSSLGYSTFNDPTQNHSHAQLDGNTSRATRAADMAVSKGMVCVVSAGNEGSGSWQRITIPSDGDSVLAIGAVDYLGNYVSFSGKGPSYDGRVKPDVAAQGQSVVMTASNGTFSTGNGTSFSSPLVAGMVACLWQANPSMTAMEIIQAIRASGSQFFSPDSLKGYGIPDFAIANLTLNGIQYHDFQHETLVNAFPNPFHDSFSIDFFSPDSQRIHIEVLDISGKTVFSKNFPVLMTSYNRIPIRNLGHLPAGMYSLRITSRSEVYQSKLLKTK